MLSAGIGCIGFSWVRINQSLNNKREQNFKTINFLQAASPACTELEIIVVDWFGRAIGLPKDFLALEKDSKGGELTFFFSNDKIYY